MLLKTETGAVVETFAPDGWSPLSTPPPPQPPRQGSSLRAKVSVAVATGQSLWAEGAVQPQLQTAAPPPVGTPGSSSSGRYAPEALEDLADLPSTLEPAGTQHAEQRWQQGEGYSSGSDAGGAESASDPYDEDTFEDAEEDAEEEQGTLAPALGATAAGASFRYAPLALPAGALTSLEVWLTRGQLQCQRPSPIFPCVCVWAPPIGPA